MFKLLKIYSEKFGKNIDKSKEDSIIKSIGFLRNKAKRVNVDECIDTCGTGGDGQNTFNISTAAAIVAGWVAGMVNAIGHFNWYVPAITTLMHTQHTCTHNTPDPTTQKTHQQK